MTPALNSKASISTTSDATWTTLCVLLNLLDDGDLPSMACFRFVIRYNLIHVQILPAMIIIEFQAWLKPVLDGFSNRFRFVFYVLQYRQVGG